MRVAEGDGLHRRVSVTRLAGRVPRPTAGRLFVLMAAFYAALAAYFVPQIDASGDEPHYLLMAQSLWREHDLDLRDNYAREDWREFRGGPTAPHYAAPRKDGRPFPGHSPGLPFLLAPVYALGQRLGCAMLLGAMVAGVGALAFWIAAAEGLPVSSAVLAGLLASGPPLAAYALHIYTEAATTLALFAAYALLRYGKAVSGAAGAAALACVLPFLHPRMALGSLAIALAAFAYRERVSLRGFAGVALLGLIAYGLFWMSIFGVPTALGVYGGAPDDTILNPLPALIGLLLDRAYGILPYAPAFLALFLLKGPARTSEKDGRNRRIEIGFMAAVLLPALFWRMWWGGQSPPARLIAPMVPFLALALARLFSSLARFARGAIVAGVLWSWALFLFAALQPGRLLFINRRARPTRVWDALWPGGPLDRLLPDLARPEPFDWLLASAWLSVLGFSVLLIRRAQARAAIR